MPELWAIRHHLRRSAELAGEVSRVYARDTRTRARGRQVFVGMLAPLGFAAGRRGLIQVGWVYDAAP